MKYFLILLIAVLLVQATLAKSKGKGKKRNSSSDSDSSSNSGSNEKKNKKCPPCPPQKVQVCPPQRVLVIREVTVCEQDQKKLTCPSGTSITIHEAFYGRKNTFTCRHSVPAGRDDFQVCTAARALDIVRRRCNGIRECDVASADTWLTDSCRGTYKYLEVSFSCS